MQTSSKSAAEIVSTLRAIHLSTDRDAKLAEQLDRLLQADAAGRRVAAPVRFAAGLETRGIAFIEPPGGGKTTAIRRALLRRPELNPPGGRPLHLHVQVPSPATLKSLGVEILAQTGLESVSERAKVWEIWRGVRGRLAALGIVVLWIDEAQDLFLSRSAREIDDMLKMLKSLMQGDDAVVLILSGTERLGEITSYDPQVDRRVVKIVPDALTIGAHEERLTKLVADYAAKAGLALDWSDVLSSRLIHAGRGRFGRIVETIVNAVERALDDGDATLVVDHFAEVWCAQEGCAWHDCVFVSPNWATSPLDLRAAEFDAARTERQRKQLGRS